MEALGYCKMQVFAVLLLAYICAMYFRESIAVQKFTKQKKTSTMFDILLVCAIVAIAFDGATMISVNYLSDKHRIFNLSSHLGMLVFYELFSICLFLHFVITTTGMTKKKVARFGYVLPGAVCILLTIANIGNIDIVEGKEYNYAMGFSVTVAYLCIAFYSALTMGALIVRKKYIAKAKFYSFETIMAFVVVAFVLDCAFPEFLGSSMATTLVTINLYINIENPMLKGLAHYHKEMVTGFATLVENRDDSTGGHIKRTSDYAIMIAKNLRKNKKYSAEINKDFLINLSLAAPMHDVGKIGIPDAVLKKPAKLDEEEFAIMKTHSEIGGTIINNTFGNLLNGEYKDMAYDIAFYHHEKWNGKGYPYGISGTDIPLCARIVAVADVFDALSAKRCYKEALPLNVCFDIIEKGRGTDFDPEIVDAFLKDKELVERIYATEPQIDAQMV